jgi:general secretion pathway protein L
MTTQSSSSLLHSSPIARWLGHLFDWWGGELSALLPARLRPYLITAKPNVIVSFATDNTRFTLLVDGQEPRMLSDIARPGSDKHIAITDRLLQKIGKPFRLLISLPAQSFFRRSVTLPLATEENLSQTLAFELDRFTPFKAQETYFDFRVTGRDTARQVLELDLVVARRTEVDRLVERAQSLGLNVDGVAFEYDILGGQGFVSGGSQPLPKRSNRIWLRIFLGLLVAVLVAVLLGIPIWQKRAAAISLLQPMAEARLASQEADAQRDRLDMLVAEHNALPDKKWDAPSLLQILDELSLRLKDDTFVLNFSFEGKVIVLQGESSTASTLVEVLEASPLFHNVSYKSPLVRMPGGAHDRFHISAEITNEGMLKKPSPDPSAEKTAQ